MRKWNAKKYQGYESLLEINTWEKLKLIFTRRTSNRGIIYKDRCQTFVYLCKEWSCRVKIDIAFANSAKKNYNIIIEIA